MAQPQRAQSVYHQQPTYAPQPPRSPYASQPPPRAVSPAMRPVTPSGHGFRAISPAPPAAGYPAQSQAYAQPPPQGYAPAAGPANAWSQITGQAVPFAHRPQQPQAYTHDRRHSYQAPPTGYAPPAQYAPQPEYVQPQYTAQPMQPQYTAAPPMQPRYAPQPMVQRQPSQGHPSHQQYARPVSPLPPQQYARSVSPAPPQQRAVSPMPPQQQYARSASPLPPPQQQHPDSHPSYQQYARSVSPAPPQQYARSVSPAPPPHQYARPVSPLPPQQQSQQPQYQQPTTPGSYFPPPQPMGANGRPLPPPRARPESMPPPSRMPSSSFAAPTAVVPPSRPLLLASASSSSSIQSPSSPLQRAPTSSFPNGALARAPSSAATRAPPTSSFPQGMPPPHAAAQLRSAANPPVGTPSLRSTPTPSTPTRERPLPTPSRHRPQSFSADFGTPGPSSRMSSFDKSNAPARLPAVEEADAPLSGPFVPFWKRAQETQHARSGTVSGIVSAFNSPAPAPASLARSSTSAGRPLPSSPGKPPSSFPGSPAPASVRSPPTSSFAPALASTCSPPSSSFPDAAPNGAGTAGRPLPPSRGSSITSSAPTPAASRAPPASSFSSPVTKAPASSFPERPLPPSRGSTIASPSPPDVSARRPSPAVPTPQHGTRDLPAPRRQSQPPAPRTPDVGVRSATMSFAALGFADSAVIESPKPSRPATLPTLSRSGSPTKATPRISLDDAPPPPSPGLRKAVPPVQQQQQQQQQQQPARAPSQRPLPQPARNGSGGGPRQKISFHGSDAGAYSDSSDEAAPTPPRIAVSSPAPPRVAVSSPAPPRIAVAAPPPPAISVNAPPAPPVISVDAPEPPAFTFTVDGDDAPPAKKAPRQLDPSQRPPPGAMACGGCGKAIVGRLVSAIGCRWHPACFQCCVCSELLEHVSSYEHENRPYCHLDYHEIFAPRCYHCKTPIVDERFVTLDDDALGKRTYHEQHFFCAECGDPFLAPSRPRAEGDRGLDLTISGDGAFEDDDVGFTVYKGHAYCEGCHVNLRLPKCKKCRRPIRDGARAVEALGGKWCWGCFTCAGCGNPFEDPSFFEREGYPFCEHCFSIIIKNEI